MSWNGLEGLNLADVEIKTNTILKPGRHVVKIVEAKVVSNEKNKTHQLELEYKNDDGSLRQWIILNHPTSEAAVRIGKEQLKKLLLLTGHDGNEAPSPDYFKGKNVGVGVKEETYNQKTQTRVSYHFDAAEIADKSKASAEPLDDIIPF